MILHGPESKLSPFLTHSVFPFGQPLSSKDRSADQAEHDPIMRGDVDVTGIRFNFGYIEAVETDDFTALCPEVIDDVIEGAKDVHMSDEAAGRNALAEAVFAGYARASMGIYSARDDLGTISYDIHSTFFPGSIALASPFRYLLDKAILAGEQAFITAQPQGEQ